MSSFHVSPSVTLYESKIGALDMFFSLKVKRPFMSILNPTEDAELLKIKEVAVGNVQLINGIHDKFESK